MWRLCHSMVMQRGRNPSYTENAALQLTSANWSACAFPPNSRECVQVTNTKGTPASGRISPISFCIEPAWNALLRQHAQEVMSTYTYIVVVKSRKVIIFTVWFNQKFSDRACLCNWKDSNSALQVHCIDLVTLLYCTGQYIIKLWSYS